MTPSAAEKVRDVTRLEIGVLAPLTLALVLFGFYPMPLMDVSNPTVDVLLERVGVPDDGPDVPAQEASEQTDEEAEH